MISGKMATKYPFSPFALKPTNIQFKLIANFGLSSSRSVFNEPDGCRGSEFFNSRYPLERAITALSKENQALVQADLRDPQTQKSLGSSNEDCFAGPD